MLHIFNARNAKATARALERFMARLGFDLKHGQALDALAVMGGEGSWSALANGQLSKAAVNLMLSNFERSHIESGQGDAYEREQALVAHTGFELRYSPDGHGNVSYARVCDPLGREIAVWYQDDWADDPARVMAAILRALVRDRAASVPEESGVPARTPSEFNRKDPGVAKAPTVLDLPFDKISTVIIDAIPHFMRYCAPEGLAALFGDLPDDELGDDDDQSCRTVLELGTEDDGFIKEYDLDVGHLKSMRWDPEQKLFVDPEGSSFKFYVATPFGA